MKLATSDHKKRLTDEEPALAKAKDDMEIISELSASPPNEPARKKDDKRSQIRVLTAFLQDVLGEFRKISWPGSKESVQATWSVLALVAVITLLVLGFDWVLGHFIFGPLDHWARVHGGGINVDLGRQ